MGLIRERHLHDYSLKDALFRHCKEHGDGLSRAGLNDHIRWKLDTWRYRFVLTNDGPLIECGMDGLLCIFAEGARGTLRCQKDEVLQAKQKCDEFEGRSRNLVTTQVQRR